MTWHPGDFSFKEHGTGGNKIKITEKNNPSTFLMVQRGWHV